MTFPAELATHRGLVVLLTGVRADVDGDSIELWLEIDDGPRIRALISEWEAGMQAWGAKRDEEGRPVGDPPGHPADFLLSMSVALADDCGTAYQWHSKQAGGSGTDRVGRWSWTPAPPPAATELLIEANGGSRLAVRRAPTQAWIDPRSI